MSYLELSPWESSFLDVYSDLTSCLLWMVCAIVDVCAELYFLEAEEEEEKKDEDNEDDGHVQEGGKQGEAAGGGGVGGVGETHGALQAFRY